MVAEFGGKLNKIQIKTSESVKDGKFEVGLKSSTMHNGVCHYHTYSKDEIDYFTIYNLESDILMLVPISELENRTAITISISYTPSRNQFKSFN